MSQSKQLLEHARPFEDEFKPGSIRHCRLGQALDQAKTEGRVLVLGLHGGARGERRIAGEVRGARRAFTGSGSASSLSCLRQDRRPSISPRSAA